MKKHETWVLTFVVALIVLAGCGGDQKEGSHTYSAIVFQCLDVTNGGAPTCTSPVYHANPNEPIYCAGFAGHDIVGALPINVFIELRNDSGLQFDGILNLFGGYLDPVTSNWISIDSDQPISIAPGQTISITTPYPSPIAPRAESGVLIRIFDVNRNLISPAHINFSIS
jgi:hypothetical protein